MTARGTLTPPGDATKKHEGHGHVQARPLVALGALGVVFGDLGTSPLYAMSTLFTMDDGIVKATPSDVYGVISMIFWSITVVISIKYVVFILRADNEGEGGVLALAALVRRHARPGTKRSSLVMLLGVVGASLFYGDSVITPAVSVLSAIEGLSVPAPELAQYVVPLAMTVITLLFLGQRLGTHFVGRFFGPVMVVWFVSIGALGLEGIINDPAILKALLPTYAALFIVQDPLIAFIAMGAVVLSITGAEALYADMGHFGASAIRRAWFGLAMPALLLNYMGQGALVLDHPEAASDSFFLLAPSWAQLPMVILATLATVIASQAVISGAFSVSRQAERLGYLPRLTVRHTSERSEGQIYVPSVNWILYGGVMILLVVFPASEKLATAYGLAVTGTFLITTALFLVFAQAAWHWSPRMLLLVGIPLVWLEGTYFVANLAKLFHGGWLPLLIATLVGVTMLTWQRGRIIVTNRRLEMEGPISDFVDWVKKEHVDHVAGTAVFLHPTKLTAPLALRENAEFNHVLHKEVFIVTATPQDVPHVPAEDRIRMDPLGDPYDHITHLELHFGFSDDQDVPEALREAQRQGIPIDPDRAFYFISRITIHRGSAPPNGKVSMSGWRKRLFIGLSHNAANPAEYFRLPAERTVVMGAQIHI
ncbi:MAG TPA: potassium transporter Kup [Dermatophilaceae bacterium]|nr:potassium transporter Kup [Dermatophilaceae bacterium]